MNFMPWVTKNIPLRAYVALTVALLIGGHAYKTMLREMILGMVNGMLEEETKILVLEVKT
jgi:hypothetical protein